MPTKQSSLSDKMINILIKGWILQHTVLQNDIKFQITEKLMNIQDEFIATVSHEMRTPLTSIRGFSQTLLSSWDKLDDESKKKFVNIIGEQSNRLINLVENILTVSKLNSDKPLLRAVNVNTSIEKVLPIIIQKYPEHKFVKNFDKKLPPAMLDDEKFQQIMTNLLDNGGKYSEGGKYITVSTSLEKDAVVIKVKDEGVGIPKEDLTKIFEKFTRLENHLTSKTQGNGLGLYITKTLVESMNGKITVNSEENTGTEFTLNFPIYNQEEALKCSLQS